ncbi:hypothetical protein QCE49_24265 [Caballeronia sp. LZ008]|uniref:hypothetical protein n=1 Tax=unclassified Caballeronia TaxID=2646786 RepID=UPI002027D18C|nr:MULTISPECIES: hypothetical protein [unclassified Caballeronia]MDR5796504.1 hypothetical protein [Caballeronia sp. LZ008]
MHLFKLKIARRRGRVLQLSINFHRAKCGAIRINRRASFHALERIAMTLMLLFTRAIWLSSCSECRFMRGFLESGHFFDYGHPRIMPIKLMMRKRGRTKSSSKSLFFGPWTAPQRAKSLYRAQSDEAGDAQKAWPALLRLPLRLVEESKHALGSWRRSGQQLRRIYAIRNAQVNALGGERYSSIDSLPAMRVPRRASFGRRERSAMLNFIVDQLD